MNKRQQWIELRNDLNVVARELAATENGTSAREVVESFHKRRALLIRAAAEMLIDTALTRLVGDVIKRRADKNIEVDQSELFQRTINDVIAVSSNANGVGKKDRYRVVGSLPIGFAEQVIKHHMETRRRKKDQFDIYKQVLDFVAPYVTSKEMTLNEAFATANAASGASRAGGKP